MVLKIRFVGLLLFLVGLGLIIRPDWVGLSVSTESVFAAAESRVRWGFILVLGLAFLLYTRLKPWPVLVATLGLSVAAGYSIARIIAIVLEGADINQWLYLAAEILLAIPFIVWYRKLNAAKSGASDASDDASVADDTDSPSDKT